MPAAAAESYAQKSAKLMPASLAMA